MERATTFVIYDDYFFSVEAENIDSVDCDVKNNITVMHGSDYNFKIFGNYSVPLIFKE